MLFDKPFAIAIAIVFGLCGLPWGWWLMRKEALFGKFEKAVLGYALGILLVPLLFLLENMAGINYTPALIVPNWLVVLATGTALLYHDMKKHGEKFRFNASDFYPALKWLAPAGLTLIMLATLFMGWSGSVTPLYELDPYYYMEGVHQVAAQGLNFNDDGTAWWPLEQSSHIGQPLYKFLLAPWYSLYNGDAPYNPYTLNAVGSIYPPIMGALAVFFIYMLFKIIHDERIGFFAAGSLAFMPVMLAKFQGGDTQIAPYNVFGLIILLCGMAYLLKRPKDFKAVLFATLGYAAIGLGSNVGSVALIVVPALLAMIGLEYFLNPTADNSREKFDIGLKLIGAVGLVRFTYFAYSLRAGFGFAYAFGVMLPPVLACVAALGGPWVLGEALKLLAQANPDQQKAKSKDVGLGFKLGALVVLALVGFAAFMALRDWGPVKGIVTDYVFFGAYTEPLHRTIAEQGAGSRIYNDQLGFLSAPLDLDGYYHYRLGQNWSANAEPLGAARGDLLASLYSLAFAFGSALNYIPTLLLNGAYALFIAVMNMIAGFETFIFIEKLSSLMTLFAFGSVLLVGADFLWELYHNRPWPIEALAVMPFAVPIMMMSFQKQKLVIYLGIALVLIASIFFGRLAAVLRAGLNWHGQEHRKGKAGAPAPLASGRVRAALSILFTCLLVALVLVQFTGLDVLSFQWDASKAPGQVKTGLANIYSSNAPALLKYSFTPRIYDDPKGVYPKLVQYCQNAPSDPICPDVQNWEATVNDPVKYFNPQLCARSLWPYATRAQPSDIGVSVGYRCSFVSGYWLEVMDWMSKNLPSDARVESWWDYGHWTNFFGQRYTVLRNEHASEEMIGRTAYVYLQGTPKELRQAMKAYGSRYALMDIEILGSGPDREHMQMGGKYGALSYIGCAWAKQTDVTKTPGTSQCELNHLWGNMLVPTQAPYAQECTISEAAQKKGVLAYRLMQVKTKNGVEQQAAPAFCVTQGALADSSQGLLVYDMRQKDSNGDLKPYYARWLPQYQDNTGSIVFTDVYDHKKLWRDENGTAVDSWGNRQGEFYNSTLYQGFFTDSVEGFDLVYSSPQIRIFKMTDEYWNKKE